MSAKCATLESELEALKSSSAQTEKSCKEKEQSVQTLQLKMMEMEKEREVLLKAKEAASKEQQEMEKLKDAIKSRDADLQKTKESNSVNAALIRVWMSQWLMWCGRRCCKLQLTRPRKKFKSKISVFRRLYLQC